MTQEQIIDRLKWLIQDWEEEVQCLEEMVDNWENHDDPGSDPGLQFEQEMKIERHWKEIADFCKDNLK